MPRVIAGTAGGRHLKTPDGRGTRPTSDRAKEALFSILHPFLDENTRFLDLFAGSGAIGIEALSRGARDAVFVDEGRASIRLIHANLDACGFLERSKVLEMEVMRALDLLGKGGEAFDIVFLDPPYIKDYARPCIEKIICCGIITERGILVAEHEKSHPPPDEILGYHSYDRRIYGISGFSFYRKRRKET
ncbi:MAG: 16S rRNA (guanine(966)-N(2))-methyltransferase RsmD [Clostridia bacterium]